MPSTYEHIVPEYADFGDLSEDVLFPGEFDLSEFGNKSMPNVIWSNSGKDIIPLTLMSSYEVSLWSNGPGAHLSDNER